jgi:hypothetical protein
VTERKRKHSLMEEAFGKKVRQYKLDRAALDDERKKLDIEVAVMTKMDISGSDIIELNVGGTHMSALRETLCAVESNLSSMFSGRWDGSHKIDKEGRTYLEFDPVQFSGLVNVLRDHRMNAEATEMMMMPDESFSRLWKYLALPLPKEVNFTNSEILVDIEHANALHAMLSAGEVDAEESPTLLYSVDGDADAAEFHSLCDGRGKTVTVVRCTNGFIFGGYNPVSWASSGKARAATGNEFLFSLKNPAGAAPAKYPVTPGDVCAVYNDSSCGPTFGNGQDLYCGGGFGGSPFIFFPRSYQDTTGRSRGTFTTLHRVDDFDEIIGFSIAKLEVWRVGAEVKIIML